MRIAISGSHRVGKTSLAEEIANSLPNYKFWDEPYLQLEEKGNLFSETPSIDDYIEQFNFSVEQIKNSENDVIFDRCPLDILAYIYSISKTKNISLFYEEMTKAISQIDILVFVPIERPDLIICQESDLPNLRHEVNSVLQDWISELHIDILEVNGTLENRKKQLLDKLINLDNRKNAQ
jgi:deoxyadenosine/deoxycytidine kinase